MRVSLTPRARPPRGRKRTTVRLRTLTLTLGAGDTRLLRPRVSVRQARSLTRALRGRRGLVATVQVQAAASVGAPTAVSRQYQATR